MLWVKVCPTGWLKFNRKMKPVNNRINKLQSIAKKAFADLLDQKSPFGKLALLHMLVSAGDTLVTVSLAGSLFFSISPTAARSHVMLYLVITMAPFSVVAPFLGSLLDSSKAMRKSLVLFSSASRAILCFFMAQDINSLLLFPLAFLYLVASKVYVVTRGALVTETMTPESDLATLNARLAFLAAIAGMAVSIPGAAILKLVGSSWDLRIDIIIFVVSMAAGLRLTNTIYRADQEKASRISKRKRYRRDLTSNSPQVRGLWNSPRGFLALSAMSVLRGAVGFLVFFLAFFLRRINAPLWIYGLILTCSAVGSVVGNITVPRLRKILTEEYIVLVALLTVCIFSAMLAFLGGLLINAVLAFVVAMMVAIARPSLDSIVQTQVPTLEQGKAFARIETQLQLVWVLGAIIPVIFSLPLVAGQIILAGVTGIGAASYLSSKLALDRAN